MTSKQIEALDILKKAEIKRTAENLTKMELCSIFNINYNFYMNCIAKRNYPSQIMIDSLRLYLETSSSKVYEMVFAHRATDEYIRKKDKNKYVLRDGEWKEEFHEALEMTDDEYAEYSNALVKKGIIDVKSDKEEQ